MTHELDGRRIEARLALPKVRPHAEEEEEKAWTLPHILFQGVVRNLKATHSPPLD
jgi:hypothetical protein